MLEFTVKEWSNYNSGLGLVSHTLCTIDLNYLHIAGIPEMESQHKGKFYHNPSRKKLAFSF